MKKFFLLGVIAVSLSLTSCDDGKPHCWEITSKGTVGEVTNTSKGYEYGTADEVDAQIKLGKAFAEAFGAKNVKITKKKLNLSEVDCLAKKVEAEKNY